MRLREFITESAKLWGAKVRVDQANYVGYVDAQVWAPNANIARTILKQQYNIQDHHVGSVKEIKMKAKEFVKEAYGDSSSLLNRIRAQQGTPTADNPEGRAELRRREQERQNQDEVARRRHAAMIAQLDSLYAVEREIAAVARMRAQGVGAEELDRVMNQAFDRYKQRWQQHHPADPQATPEEKRNAEEMKQQAEVYMGQAQRLDQPAQLPTPTNEALNPALSKILAAANSFASGVANMKIYKDDIFANYLKSTGLGAMVDWYKQNFTDKNYAEAQRQAASAKQDLDGYGVKVDYNEVFPTDFTLEIPGHNKPYSFNLINLLKSTMDSYNTKSTNEDLSRMADLAGVPLKEAWNANMGKIYEAANLMAIAVYNLFILSNPAFRKREDPDGRLYATLQEFDPENFEDTKELSRRDLADHGAKLTYNANNPRMFTLNVPKMEPYTFDVKEVVDTAVN